MENETIKPNDKPWLFKKGNPGGPGRPKGKRMKEYARDYLAHMTEEERQDFMEGLPKEVIWKMAEGNPKQDTDLTTGGKSFNSLQDVPTTELEHLASAGETRTS